MEPETDLIQELMVRHARPMAQWTYRQTGSRELAEDLVQETFLLAYSKRETLCRHENPAGWLYCVLRHMLEKERRRQRVMSGLPAEPDRLPGDADVELPMAAYLPQGLSREEQELLLLRLEQKRSFGEIAGLLQIGEAACRQRYHRVVKKCKKLMRLTSGPPAGRGEK